MDPMILAPFFMLALLPLMWIGVCWLLALVSGWRTLAARHPDREPAAATRIRGVSGTIGWVNFNHVLALEIDARGVRFSLWPPIFPGHKPFHLAWDAFQSLDVVKGTFRRRLELELRDGPKIRLFGAAVDAVVAASKPGAHAGIASAAPRSGSVLPIVLLVAAVVVVIAAAMTVFFVAGRA